jgi:hypothetical protein
MIFIKKNLLGFFCFITCGLTASTFTEVMHSKVRETIESTETVPGFHPEEFSLIKRGLTRMWNTLVQEGDFEACYFVKDIQSYFVALQGVVEKTLLKELKSEVYSLQCVTLTQVPEILQGDYLLKGGELFVAYPKEGLNTLAEAQQRAYRKSLKDYPSKIKEIPLESASIPIGLTGVIYFFENQEGERYVFAVKISKEIDAQVPGVFGLWFGRADNPVIEKRVRAVAKHLEEGGSDLLSSKEDLDLEVTEDEIEGF